MKLAALGAITAGIGVALDVPGLLGIGALWVLLGYPAWLHRRRIAAGRADADGAGRPAIDGKTFGIGTALLLAVGVPALVVGVVGIGFDPTVDGWRWLPLVVGGLATGIAVISGVLYLAGSAIGAHTTNTDATVPATLWIRSMTETGTYVNNRPRLAFELTVEPDAASGLAPYDVAKKATAPFTAIAGLKVGGGFRALVAGPDDPTSMEIHWDQPVAGAPEAAAEPLAATTSVTERLDELERLRREARITDEEYRAQRERILGSL